MYQFFEKAFRASSRQPGRLTAQGEMLYDNLNPRTMPIVH